MKLFVAKLNRDAVESDLLEWFGAMGPVRSAKIVTDRDTGQSKCFGFVEMETREGGERAIAEMNGQEFMNFQMVVKEAEERGSRPRPAPGNRQGSSDVRSSSRSSSDSRGTGDSGPRPGGGGSFGADKKACQKEESPTHEARQIFGWSAANKNEENQRWRRVKKGGLILMRIIDASGLKSP